MSLYSQIRLSLKITVWIMYLCLFVSLSALVVYFIDLQFSDNLLLLLLIVIRYSSFMLFFCAIYKLVVNIYHFFRRPGIQRAMKSVLYLLFIFYGMAMVFLESVVMAVSRGNV